MFGEQLVPESELIIRRIPPDGDPKTVKPDAAGVLRPTSGMMATRSGEAGLSCSRKAVTPPSALLAQLKIQGKDPSGWMVCEIPVAAVNALGFNVIVSPTEIDPGHCEVRPTGELTFSKGNCRKLARVARIITVGDDPKVK
ncbi:hypothetical protein Fuma_05003 [Fuerstiella marisgermanici]|uniref:Uncharacterized protein n=1 Tax=Fuerstiella marisgermanici TaxID=1891926 RepID=A0A1P8WMT3_9PLAN|nr:hypothetical protein Fuma_05003 [Fuerstiella marisgermanici]